MQTFLIKGNECTMMPQMTAADILWFSEQQRACPCCGGSGYHKETITLYIFEFTSLRPCRHCEATGKVHYCCFN